jgi:hypothetical protein
MDVQSLKSDKAASPGFRRNGLGANYMKQELCNQNVSQKLDLSKPKKASRIQPSVTNYPHATVHTYSSKGPQEKIHQEASRQEHEQNLPGLA